MITKLIGAATLFAAGSLVAGPATLGVRALDTRSSEAALGHAGGCGAKEEGKPAEKGKEGGCGKAATKEKKEAGKEAKKEKKDGGCGSKEKK